LERLFDEVLAVLGSANTEFSDALDTLFRQTDDIEALVSAVVDLIKPAVVPPALIEKYLSPPDDVVQLLTHSVRAFGKGVVPMH